MALNYSKLMFLLILINTFTILKYLNSIFYFIFILFCQKKTKRKKKNY